MYMYTHTYKHEDAVYVYIHMYVYIYVHMYIHIYIYMYIVYIRNSTFLYVLKLQQPERAFMSLAYTRAKQEHAVRAVPKDGIVDSSRLLS